MLSMFNAVGFAACGLCRLSYGLMVNGCQRAHNYRNCQDFEVGIVPKVGQTTRI